jgi:predicted DNA-binding protein YlxM (UPF0122 family)
MKEYLREKRNELLWSMCEQDYSVSDIGAIFGLPKSTTHDIIKKRPDGWTSPWTKQS